MVLTRFLSSKTKWVVLLLGFGIILAVSGLVVQPSLLGLTPSTEEPVPISHCTVISEEGTYILTQDIQGGGLASSCIRIKESHVTLRGGEHTLTGRGATDSTAVLVSNPHGVSDVTVRSVKATRWNRGVHIANASDIMIRDVDAWRNAEGVTIWNSTNSKVIGGRLTNNLFGIIIDQPSNDISISSIHFEGNTVGNVSRGEYQSRSTSTTGSTSIID